MNAQEKAEALAAAFSYDHYSLVKYILQNQKLDGYFKRQKLTLMKTQRSLGIRTRQHKQLLDGLNALVDKWQGDDGEFLGSDDCALDALRLLSEVEQ